VIDVGKLKEELADLFEGPVGSGEVMIQPSSMDQQGAMDVAEGAKLGEVMAEMGRLAAQAVVRDMETDGLRPADFAFAPEIPKVLRERIAHLLREGSKEFDEAFLASLGAHG
jgi:hypothetical protein